MSVLDPRRYSARTRETLGLGKRPRTENVRHISKRDLAAGRVHLHVLGADRIDVDFERPQTRGDCESGARPCPFVGCQHNLYIDVDEEIGSIKFNFPDLEPDQVPAEKSCALDVASGGGGTLEDVASTMNITRERVRQIEAKAIARVQRGARGPGRAAAVLREYSQVEAGAIEPPPVRVGQLGGSVFAPRAEPAEPAEADDEPPTRISFFAEPDSERVDELVANSVWLMFARDSNQRGMGVTSNYSRAATLRLAKRREGKRNQEVPQVTKDEFADAHHTYVSAHGRTPSASELFEAIGPEGISVENTRAGVKRAGLKLTDMRLVGRLPEKKPRAKAAPQIAAPSSRKTSRDPVVASLIEKRDELRRKAEAIDVAIEALSTVL